MMIRKLVALTVVGIALLSSTEARSQDYFNQNASKWYISGFGGWTGEVENSFSLDTAGPGIGDDAFGININTESGYGIGAAIGRRFSNNLRLESEFVFRNHSLDNIVTDAGGLAVDFLGADPDDVADALDGVSARVNSYTLATNLVYDFRRGAKINPYVGFGTGVQFVGNRLTEEDNDLEVQLNYPTVIYQWMAGVSSPLNQRSDLFVEYRGFGTFGTTAPGSLGPDSVRFKAASYQDSVFAGLRFNF